VRQLVERDDDDRRQAEFPFRLRHRFDEILIGEQLLGVGFVPRAVVQSADGHLPRPPGLHPFRVAGSRNDVDFVHGKTDPEEQLLDLAAGEETDVVVVQAPRENHACGESAVVSSIGSPCSRRSAIRSNRVIRCR